MIVIDLITDQIQDHNPEIEDLTTTGQTITDTDPCQEIDIILQDPMQRNASIAKRLISS